MLGIFIGLLAMFYLESPASESLHPPGQDYQIQRYFSHLTFMQEGWEGWDLEKTGEWDSYRYSLAHVGYATALHQQLNTPIYNGVSCQILNNVLQRYRRYEVWEYWSDSDQHNPPFCQMSSEGNCPDPIKYQNVMYSGHLANLIGLYEKTCQDYTYSEAGWDFAWNDSSIHYNASQLMGITQRQVLNNPTGGVACEPGMVFSICNNYPRAAFILYDQIHGTQYSNSNPKWQKFLEESAIRNDSDYFFNIVYSQKKKNWIDKTYNTTGGVSDAWMLSWIKSWYTNVDLLEEAIKAVRNNPNWNYRWYKGAWLNETGRPADIGTSLYLMAESQLPVDHPRGSEIKRWMRRFGTYLDTDQDGYADSFFFNSSKSGKVWSTANMLASNSLHATTLQGLYHHPVSPNLITGVDYPSLIITRAQYASQSRTFFITWVAERLRRKTELECDVSMWGPNPNISVTLDLRNYYIWNLDQSRLTVTLSLSDRRKHYLMIENY